MNIVQIGPYPISSDCIQGGVEASVYGLTQALARAQHVVDVFDIPRIGGEDNNEYEGLLTVHRYANRGKHNMEAVQRCGDILRDIVALRPDVLHIHGTGKFSSALYEAAKECGFPIFLTVHGLLYEEKKQALLRKPSLKHLYQYFVQTRAEFALLNKISRIVVDTQYVRKEIEKYYQKSKIANLPEMYVIPQGIDAEYYDFACDSGSKTILSVGSISPRKGHVFTLKAFNILRNRGIFAKLCIIGSLADAEYYAKLSELIHKSPYVDDITLKTNVTRNELFSAYKSADVFALHSQEESQGIVFAEAMAIGLPIVATKVGGIPYVVENGKSGFLCDFGNTQMMAEMLGRLLSEYKLWNSFSVYARSASLQYSWDKIATQICDFYERK